MLFRATIICGKLKIHAEKKFREWIARYRDDDLFEVDIKKWRKNRSLKQNNYYWGGIVEPLSDTTGYTLDETHSYLKEKFLSKREIIIGKEVLSVEPTTTKLNSLQFSQYIEKIRDWAAKELNCYLMSPDEYMENRCGN